MHNMIKLSCKHRLTKENKVMFFNPITCKLFADKDKLSEDDKIILSANNRNSEIIKKEKITTVRLYLGSTCNYRCSYCRQNNHTPYISLTEDEIKSIVEMIHNTVNIKHPYTVEFWGGEPLIYFKEISSIADKLYGEVRYSIVSNGSLLNADIYKWIRKHKVRFVLSHDGPGQHHRGSDPLSHKDSKRYLQLLNTNKSDRLSFSINTVLTEDNKDIYETYKQHALTFGSGVIISRMELVIPYNEGSTSVSNDISSDTIQCLMNGMSKLEEEGLLKNIVNIQQDIDTFVNHHLDDNYCTDIYSAKCSDLLSTSITIDKYGNKYPCQVYGDTDIVIGHVSTDTDILLPRTLLSQNCHVCPVVSICKGTCPWMSEEHLQASCFNKFVFNLAIFKYILSSKTGYDIYNIETIEV